MIKLFLPYSKFQYITCRDGFIYFPTIQTPSSIKVNQNESEKIENQISEKNDIGNCNLKTI